MTTHTLLSLNGVPVYAERRCERFGAHANARGARNPPSSLKSKALFWPGQRETVSIALSWFHFFATLSQSPSYTREFIGLLVGAIPPCSRGGPIEAVPQKSCPIPRRASFRRVHAAAPLKRHCGCPCRACLGAFRRVHAAAPLKQSGRELLDLARRVIPPCSRGGPIEAGRAGTSRSRHRPHSAVFTRRPH